MKIADPDDVADVKYQINVQKSSLHRRFYKKYHVDPKEMELEIATFAKENTAMYKCPRIYEFVKELPKTISGKIRRVEIREKDKGKDANKIKQDF